MVGGKSGTFGQCWLEQLNVMPLMLLDCARIFHAHVASTAASSSGVSGASAGCRAPAGGMVERLRAGRRREWAGGGRQWRVGTARHALGLVPSRLTA